MIGNHDLLEQSLERHPLLERLSEEEIAKGDEHVDLAHPENGGRQRARTGPQ